MVALFFVSLYLIRLNRRASVELQALGYIGLFLALGSFTYHATGTWFGQMLDVSGMLLFSSHYFLFNISRLVSAPRQVLVSSYFICVGLAVAAMFINHMLGLAIFSMQVAITLLAELHLFFRDSKSINYKPYLLAISSFVIGLIFWFLDFYKIICYPSNHILTGHGIWHLSNAFVFFFTAKFMKQII